MTALTGKLWFNDFRSFSPLSGHGGDSVSRNGGLVAQSDQHGIRGGRYSFDTSRYRDGHRARGVVIHREKDCPVPEFVLNFLSAMAHNDDYPFNAATLQVIDATLNDGQIAKRQERLKRAHAP